MLIGALFWGVSGDIIGRRFAFNVSLFLCSAFTIVAGAAPNWVSLAVFIALLGFGGGGNLILDTTVFIEYLPSKKQWVLSTQPDAKYGDIQELSLILNSLACCLVGIGTIDCGIPCLGLSE
jgi:MFS family permease